MILLMPDQNLNKMKNIIGWKKWKKNLLNIWLKIK